MKEFDIYTDGACSGNPGKGGYAFVIIAQGKPLLKMSGCEEHATNNMMELKAVVRSLKHLESQLGKMKSIVRVHSDSAYCINPIIQGWMDMWKENGWKTKSGDPIKNVEMWQELDSLLEDKRMQVEFIKVKGHSGDKFNEMVDKAARNAINRLNVNAFPSRGV